MELVIRQYCYYFFFLPTYMLVSLVPLKGTIKTEKNKTELLLSFALMI